MLSALSIRPPMTDLYALIDKVPVFPLKNRQLVEFAAKISAPKDVIDFYKTFNDSRIYKSKNELTTLSEQVDLMRQEESQMPKEVARDEEY